MIAYFSMLSESFNHFCLFNESRNSIQEVDVWKIITEFDPFYSTKLGKIQTFSSTAKTLDKLNTLDLELCLSFCIVCYIGSKLGKSNSVIWSLLRPFCVWGGTVQNPWPYSFEQEIIRIMQSLLRHIDSNFTLPFSMTAISEWLKRQNMLDCLLFGKSAIVSKRICFTECEFKIRLYSWTK